MSTIGVLFDLDGTLVDTAPDLVAVLNELLHESGRVRMPFAIARNEVSNGAIGLLRLGFGEFDAPEELDTLRARFLEIYRRSVCVNSKLFMDIDTLFREEGDFAWGIVTNKPQAFTEPLLAQLGIAGRWGTVVSGDRLPQRKPDPAPLLLAARELGIAPGSCVYIGDAPRDIEAGRAAGMKTVAAAFGYIRPHEDPTTWGADFLVRQPREIPAVLRQLRRSAAA
ncbi:MAG: HAD-IA family hydrolase [Gammaproteobacteria bacterium]